MRPSPTTTGWWSPTRTTAARPGPQRCSREAGEPYDADEIGEFLVDLDRLPAIGYDLIARQASPLIVHGPSLAERIHRETGIRPEVVPFVPYNVPTLETIDDAVARGVVELLASRTTSCMSRRSASWTRARRAPTSSSGRSPGSRPGAGRLICTSSASYLQKRAASLASLAAQLGIAPYVTFHGRVKTTTLNEFLLAVDVAVQIRMSTVLSLSGALADCIAFGVPTVTTQDVADEMSAPPYVATTGSATSSLLIAEAIDGLCERRRRSPATIEAERREYLETHTVDSYARGLLAALGLWS